MRMVLGWRALGFGVLVTLVGGGCNSDNGGEPNQSPVVLAKAPTKSGDQQTGQVDEPLANDLRVLVTRDGNPVQNVTVQWSTDEGSLNPTDDQTDVDGIAATSWTLGPTQGIKAAQASISGATGSPLAFTATATEPEPPPGVTVQVLSAGGNRFDPSDLTISVGNTVTWEWPAGSLQHNIVPDDGVTPAASGPLVDGPRTYSAAFGTPGIYRYHCANHGAAGGVGMSGIVRVVTVQP